MTGSPKVWMDTADPPSVRAAKLMNEMTLDEKLFMFHGSSTGYVGGVQANTRLGIPALHYNDGPQGFRDNSFLGSTTSFPSGLTIGATFDVVAAQQWGSAMGKEFFLKGANVQLGPGMCIARVPRNGRNFEYIAGEDPFLGYTMVGPVIEGIQSQNVIANAKHWVNNNQETNRQSSTKSDSADVDERTEFEIYYPPFKGACDWFIALRYFSPHPRCVQAPRSHLSLFLSLSLSLSPPFLLSSLSLSPSPSLPDVRRDRRWCGLNHVQLQRNQRPLELRESPNAPEGSQRYARF